MIIDKELERSDISIRRALPKRKEFY